MSQRIEQAEVVTSQTEIVPGQGITKIAFFNPDGTPWTPEGGGGGGSIDGLDVETIADGAAIAVTPSEAAAMVIGLATEEPFNYLPSVGFSGDRIDITARGIVYLSSENRVQIYGPRLQLDTQVVQLSNVVVLVPKARTDVPEYPEDGTMVFSYALKQPLFYMDGDWLDAMGNVVEFEA